MADSNGIYDYEAHEEQRSRQNYLNERESERREDRIDERVERVERVERAEQRQQYYDPNEGASVPGPSRPTRHTHKEKTHNINVGFRTGGGNGGGGGRGGDRDGGGNGGGGGGDRHQGDRLIYNIERIELRSDRDILALAKTINHLGRELHLILGMRAEEINGVLSTYKGKWYTFGAGSRVKARLVSAHLKVSAEAAKALGVGALKMAHAFDRHFVKPEQEARERRNGKTARKAFSIGEDN